MSSQAGQSPPALHVEGESEPVGSGHLCPSTVATDNSHHFSPLPETLGPGVLSLGLWLARYLGQEGTEDIPFTKACTNIFVKLYGSYPLKSKDAVLERGSLISIDIMESQSRRS